MLTQHDQRFHFIHSQSLIFSLGVWVAMIAGLELLRRGGVWLGWFTVNDGVNVLLLGATLLGAATGWSGLQRLERLTAARQGAADRLSAAQRELELRAAELVAASRRKDEFLAMLAHELRNPLAPIRYAVQLLRLADGNESLAARQREVIERQVTHMARLLDDLLDVSRITRGMIHLQKGKVDMRTVVQQTIETSRALLRERGVELIQRIPPTPQYVEGDFTRLEQVVHNLLDNAIKYTGAGGRITVSVERDPGGAERGAGVIVRVRDSGMGIEPELLPRIFDLFVQAAQSIDRSQGGLGIGLTMVDRLVEMHGGSIQASSEGSGKGSEFTVWLPLQSGAGEDTAGAPAAETQTSAALNASEEERPLKVMVVDDNIDSLESLRELIERWGYQVDTASDGLAAVKRALVFIPDVVLLDIGLPRLDGYEVARRLRAEPALAGVMLVALTGYGQSEDRRRSEEAGFDRHFTKPIGIKELKELLESVALTQCR